MEVAMPAGVKTEVRTYQMYVNGEWVESKSSKTFPVYDPATEEVIAQVPDSNADDVDRAVAAAKSAFEDGPWASTTAQERGRVLFRLAEKIRQNAAQLAELVARHWCSTLTSTKSRSPVARQWARLSSSRLLTR